MLRIGLVEDDLHDRELLLQLLRRYEKENDVVFEISVFEDGEDIVTDYSADYDLLLLDIEMRFLDGMKAAEKIRALDENVMIIFVTHMPQYALHGYKVGARDFLVKPISYFALTESMNRILRIKNRPGRTFIKISQKNGAKKVDVQRICYVEVQNHDLIYHTLDGDLVTKETMKEAEAELKGQPFFRCNRCYLVNLKYVDHFEGYFASVHSDMVQVSRGSRKQFWDALNTYISGENL